MIGNRQRISWMARERTVAERTGRFSAFLYIPVALEHWDKYSIAPHEQYCRYIARIPRYVVRF